LLVALVACKSETTETPSNTSSAVVKLATNPWDGSRLNATIAQILMTEQMGLKVEISEVDEFKQWDPLTNGELHAALEVWPSGHADDYTNYVKTGKVEDAGLLGPTGKIGWYIPTYLLTRYPALASWEGFKDAAIVDIFKTPASGNQGQFLSGDQTWVQYDADIIKNLGLDFKVVFAGTETAMIEELDRAYTKRAPILLYLWVPHSAHAKYDLTAVKLPDYSDACYAKRASGGVDCDYPTDKLYKAFWPGLKNLNPKAYTFLKNFSYTTKDQIGLLGKVNNDKQTVEQAARGWIQANQNVWKAWIPN
jgi:glycine betaine/proline transport system substrate-binding protein